MERAINDTYPVWSSINSASAQYPWLDGDICCDVCVIGGGLTGALCALRLAESGAEVVLVTACQVGYASTSMASPAFEYDGGMLVLETRKQLGHDRALELLGHGRDALDMLERLCGELDGDAGFARRDAMIYTNDESELDLLSKEYQLRRHNGFDCSFLTRSAARDVFSFELAGAIVSKNLAAEADPYRLTQLVLRRAVSLGARVFENTKAIRLDCVEDGVEIETSTHCTVSAEKAVLAVASEGSELVEGYTARRTSFLVVSEPVEHFAGWPGRCVVRTFGRPELTISAAGDRIFCGGLSTGVVDSQGRLLGRFFLPSLVNRRFEELENAVREHFPGIPEPVFEYACASEYTQSADGLPVIEPMKDKEECFLALCSGKSAGVFSMLAAEDAARYFAHESRLLAKSR